MYVLAFDTETTGLPQKRKPLHDQPHIMQLAFSLYDPERRPIFEVSTLVALPEGVEPHPQAFAVHNISGQMTRDKGVSKEAALRLLAIAAVRADLIIAHNAEYDIGLVRFETERTGAVYPLHERKVTCTCDIATPILNLPPTPKMVAAGFNKPKRAKLEECYRHFFGEELSGAHDALVDTRGCARVYFELLDRKHV